MGKMINNQTGAVYPATEAEIEAAQKNPVLKGVYTFEHTVEPEEVTELKKQLYNEDRSEPANNDED